MLQILDNQEQSKKRFQNPEVINARASQRYQGAGNMRGVFEQHFGDKVKMVGQTETQIKQPAKPELIPVQNLVNEAKSVGDIAAQAGLSDVAMLDQAVGNVYDEAGIQPINLNRILDDPQTS